MTPFKSKQLAVILSLEMVGVEKFSSFQSIVHFQGDHQLVALAGLSLCNLRADGCFLEL